MQRADRRSFREISAGRCTEWVAKGHAQRHFFAHRIHQLPKCGPDGFLLAERMCGCGEPKAMWELVLYADPALLEEFPRELFFDDELVWHQQQFGLVGQVGCASVVVDGASVYVVTLHSDLVQRISRRRECKTRIEKVFKGWSHMLLNGIASFAAERDARRVYIATADLAHRHTDPGRDVDRTIFGRIYDRSVENVLPARRSGAWWVVDVERARDSVVVPERRTQLRARRRTICLYHDVERGLGHVRVDPAFAKQAEATSRRSLAEMNAIEADLGVRATYCVAGAILPEVRDELESAGHCVAFHSFDHRLERHDQLKRCRKVDYRLKGYRVPCSEVTPELTDPNLLRHNFEWLASSPQSLGTDAPELRAGLVRVPATIDDFPLHTGSMGYEDWEQRVLRIAAERDFTAVGLHDCYAPRWLGRYRSLLRRLAELQELTTMDELAADVTLASGA